MSTSSTTKAPPSPPPGFTIRRAAAPDAEHIAILGAAVFTHTFLASGCTQAQLQAYLDEAYTPAAVRATLASPSHDTLVAVEDGGEVLLGFVLVNYASSHAEPAVAGKYPRPVELQRLYVSLDAHGRGIGTALAGAAEALARERGYETMWLGVWEGNSRAQGVYGKLGYERIGEHVFDVGGDEQIDWIMVKVL